MSPLECYQQWLTAHQFKADDQQLAVIKKFEVCYQALKATEQSFLKRWFSPPVKGFYLWGSVGIGKTALMDIFYGCVPNQKLRLHFFNFMRDIQQQLRMKQGQKNPLMLIAKDFRARYRVICFDEFFVSDIADAMILGELFQYLFQEGIILVATSNIAPDDLYKNGLQRERFLPAIDALKRNTEVIHLSTKIDYRLHRNLHTKSYLYPINDENKEIMNRIFKIYAHDSVSDQDPLVFNTHPLPIIRKSRGVLWCMFKELCEANRSSQDYLELGNGFHTVFIEGLVSIPAQDRNTVLRFIHLIDIFYDQHVRLFILAEIALDAIYPAGPHQQEFQRTESRLIDMQSAHYIGWDEAII